MEMTLSCAHNRPADTPPESCLLSGKVDLAALPIDVFASAHIIRCLDTSGYIQDDTCITNVHGLNPLQFPWSLLRLENLSGLHTRRLHYFPGAVKFCESPGRAGGLPKRN